VEQGDEHARLEAEVERLRRENDSLRLDRDSSEHQRHKDNEYLLTELAALREAAQAVVTWAEDAREVFADNLIAGAIVLRPETFYALRAALNPGAEG
jgi:hypothetical protein